jgi:glycosyltransferase domain-containing protein
MADDDCYRRSVPLDADADSAPSGVVPLVTVGIPTYNRVDLLRQAVSSVLEQHVPLRIVIADNASDDGTQQYMDEICASHPNVVYHRHQTNIGPTANANWILQHIDTPYVVWLGDDDYFAGDYLKPLVEFLEANGDFVGAVGRVVYFGGDSEFDAVPVSYVQESDYARVSSFWRTVRDNAGFLAVYRTPAVRVRGPYRSEMGEDMVRAADLVFRGRLRQDPSVTMYRRVGGATTSLRNVADVNRMGAVSRNAPQVMIAVNAARDLLHNPVYGRWGYRRIRLAVVVELTIIRRMVIPGVIKFVKTRAWRRARS